MVRAMDDHDSGDLSSLIGMGIDWLSFGRCSRTAPRPPNGRRQCGAAARGSATRHLAGCTAIQALAILSTRSRTLQVCRFAQ